MLLDDFLSVLDDNAFCGIVDALACEIIDGCIILRIREIRGRYPCCLIDSAAAALHHQQTALRGTAGHRAGLVQPLFQGQHGDVADGVQGETLIVAL